MPTEIKDAPSVQLPPMTYPRPEWQRPKHKIWIVLGIIALSGLVISVLLPSGGCPPEPGYRFKCRSNLLQIGLACAMYAHDNNVETIFTSQDLTADMFICPATADERASGATSAEAKNLCSGGHLSYVYIGAGLTTAAPPTTVIAYELPGNHPYDSKTGANVLFADGKVEFVKDLRSVVPASQKLPSTRPIKS